MQNPTKARSSRKRSTPSETASRDSTTNIVQGPPPLSPDSVVRGFVTNEQLIALLNTARPEDDLSARMNVQPLPVAPGLGPHPLVLEAARLQSENDHLIRERDAAKRSNQDLVALLRGKIAELEATNCNLQKTIADRDEELRAVRSYLQDARAQLCHFNIVCYEQRARDPKMDDVPPPDAQTPVVNLERPRLAPEPAFMMETDGMIVMDEEEEGSETVRQDSSPDVESAERHSAPAVTPTPSPAASPAPEMLSASSEAVVDMKMEDVSMSMDVVMATQIDEEYLEERIIMRAFQMLEDDSGVTCELCSNAAQENRVMPPGTTAAWDADVDFQVLIDHVQTVHSQFYVEMAVEYNS